MQQEWEITGFPSPDFALSAHALGLGSPLNADFHGMHGKPSALLIKKKKKKKEKDRALNEEPTLRKKHEQTRIGLTSVLSNDGENNAVEVQSCGIPSLLFDIAAKNSVSAFTRNPWVSLLISTVI